MNLQPLKPAPPPFPPPTLPPVLSWVNASARHLIDGCNGAIYGHSSLPVSGCFSDLVREQPDTLRLRERGYNRQSDEEEEGLEKRKVEV